MIYAIKENNVEIPGHSMIRWEVDVAVLGVQGQLPEHEQALE